MFFNPYSFILFYLPITVIFFYILGRYSAKMAKYTILIASFIFYNMFDSHLLVLLSFMIAFNYIVTLYISKMKRNRILLIFGILANLGILFYFKYLNFFITAIGSITHSDVALLSIVLPVGISFYIFQQIAYLIDVYRDRTVSMTFIDYAIFILYFPKIIQGPIMKHDEFIPKLNSISIGKFK